MWEYISNENLTELYHKGNVSETYAKASKKLNKLDSKIAKATKKSEKRIILS